MKLRWTTSSRGSADCQSAVSPISNRHSVAITHNFPNFQSHAGWKPAIQSRQVGRNLRYEGGRYGGGFSLIEILVAVALLAIIITGLLAMFYQTEKAFRLGTRQVDILESGRSTMELLVRELQELSSANDTTVTNLFVSTAFQPFVQPRPDPIPQVPPRGTPQTNYLQDYYFLVRSNDVLSAMGYFVEPPPNGAVGTLYRFSTNAPVMDLVNSKANLFRSYQSATVTDSYRVADNVIHLRIIPYDRSGIVCTNLNLLQYWFPNDDYDLPAFIDLELGILEPRTAEKYFSLLNPTDPTRADAFLAAQAARVHLFRQRIAIRVFQ